mmetsp:Transcript_9802/g.29169  ORF Transcript_9802/g.29169 Transcript_9802/m.29169 type:complete len:137 (-) Transcript_9802:2293-2703(-)
MEWMKEEDDNYAYLDQSVQASSCRSKRIALAEQHDAYQYTMNHTECPRSRETHLLELGLDHGRKVIINPWIDITVVLPSISIDRGIGTILWPWEPYTTLIETALAFLAVALPAHCILSGNRFGMQHETFIYFIAKA